MSEATFDELLQWLEEHEGRSVYLEVGTDALDTAQVADVLPVAMHVTLNVQRHSGGDESRSL
jgi:hypothetical protein